MPRTSRSLGWMMLFWVATGACSNAGLQPVPQEELGKFDNELEIEGQYCTDPEAPVAFPVKILLVLDRSGSWQFTDPNNAHFQAISQVLDATIGAPNVEFGVIAFNGAMEILPFTADRGTIDGFLTGLFPDSVTDYQGALATALRLLEIDMLESSIAERARTKYVVLFVSDGQPDPKCLAGCGNDPECYAFCDTDPDADDDDDLDPEDFEGLLVDLVVCGDYNAPWQIYQKIDQMVALRDLYAVGELRFHTLFVYSDPAPVIPPLCGGAAQYDRTEGITVMTEMAEHGQGTFKDYNVGDGIDFLHIDYTPIQRPYVLSNFIVYNTSVVTTDVGEGFLPDSDRDGLSDDEEFELGTDRLLDDTDDDGYGDFIEVRNSAAGFDPMDPAAPALPCTDRSDVDGDLLATCEEIYLETDPRLFDSDADRMPDGMEHRLGLNPLRDDAELDLDLDTYPNLEELVMGSNPARPDAERARRLGYRYRVDDGIEGATGEQCHAFGVDGLKLGVTLAPEGAVTSRGVNFIWVYAIDAAEDLPQDTGIPKAACVRARYLGESLKDPPGGQLVLTPQDFHDPASMTEADCVGYVP